MSFTSLQQHLSKELLREAYRCTPKSGATGVDGQSGADYESHLEENLEVLLEGAKSGSYRAPPVKRVYIPKGDGKETRPLGIPTFEDKALQRAVAMIVGAIYEQDFLPCSYGFRPGRSAYQCHDALREQLMRQAGGWVYEVDIRKYFDSIDHGQLWRMLDRRIRDGVLRKLIDKWLSAGVMEGAQQRRSEYGTPQGGVISPLLANIYLHEVVDSWFEGTVKARLRGRAELYRYADDLVIVLSHQQDAERVSEVLPKRLSKYGLAIHPDKTRRVELRCPARQQDGRAGSFDFLGFTFYWRRSRKGNWVIGRKTSALRLRRAAKRANQWCKKYRHQPIRWQQQRLKQKLQGHYAYFAITGNYRAVQQLYTRVVCLWVKWLGRRSNSGPDSWDWAKRTLALFPLPPPRIMRSASP